MQSPPGPQTVIDGRSYLYFAGTGYLGLQGHAEVIRAACEGAQLYGMGSATTRAWFGNTPTVLAVEAAAAQFFGAEDAFYFASGYWGSQLLLDLLDQQYDQVFVDALAHYSVLDAVRRSGRPVVRFAHADPEDLRVKLRSMTPGARPLVISDGVFSVQGTIAPVAAYDRVLAEYPDARLVLDDAHGVGVLGADGWGVFQYAGLQARGVNVACSTGVDRTPQLLVSATLSKALGGFGGIVAGSREFIGRLKSQSPVFGGASAPPPAAAAGSAKALELARTQPALRTRLWENVARLKGGLRRLGLAVDDTPTPIVCLTMGGGETIERIQSRLVEQGILIALAKGYSGVGAGGALRIAVFANHTTPMIDELLGALGKLL